MNINTQVILTHPHIFDSAARIIASSVMVTNQRVDRLNKQLELVNTLEAGANASAIYSDDYLIVPTITFSSRATGDAVCLFNLNARSRRFVDTPEQQAIVNDIKASQMRLHSVFNDVESKL